MNTKTYLTLAAVAVIALAALYIGFHLVPVVIALVVIAAVVYFVPAVRTRVFGWLGLTPPVSLSDLLGDFHTLVAKLEAHAEEAIAAASGHRADAAASTSKAVAADAAAAKATTVATNVKSLIAS